jgi:hypothetical protein
MSARAGPSTATAVTGSGSGDGATFAGAPYVRRPGRGTGAPWLIAAMVAVMMVARRRT